MVFSQRGRTPLPMHSLPFTQNLNKDFWNISHCNDSKPYRFLHFIQLHNAKPDSFKTSCLKCRKDYGLLLHLNALKLYGELRQISQESRKNSLKTRGKHDPQQRSEGKTVSIL